MAVGSQNGHYKNIGRFKFGSSVRDCHMYIRRYEILTDFNLAVVKVDHQTAKFNSPPNFPAIQYFGCSVLLTCMLLLVLVFYAW